MTHSRLLRRLLKADLGRVSDALAFYAALSDNGTRPRTMLFETKKRTFILHEAALEATCRGTEVTFTALTANGRLMLEALRERLHLAVTRSAADVLAARFKRPSSHDLKTRLNDETPFDALRALLDIAGQGHGEPFGKTLLGTLAFDHVDFLEEFPANASDPLGFPDFKFWLPDSLVVIENGEARALCAIAGCGDAAAARAAEAEAKRRIETIQKAKATIRYAVRTAPREHASAVEPKVDLDDADFAALVEAMKGHIVAGDVYQIVPSRTFSAACPDPLAAFARQRHSDPSPYMFFVNGGEEVLFGASPETAVRCRKQSGRTVIEVKPIAGTRPRGANMDEDDRLQADLRLDSKELAEHMMLVDLARNDVALVSRPGTRRVASLLDVEMYARVMHLVSSVEGEMMEGRDPFHAFAACLNVGTLSGAPKLKAIELLRGAERTRRGPYGGAIGWVSADGEADTGVIIRSALVKDGTAYVRAGAGVVHDSNPVAEAAETRAKASAVLAALGAGGAP